MEVDVDGKVSGEEEGALCTVELSSCLLESARHGMCIIQQEQASRRVLGPLSGSRSLRLLSGQLHICLLLRLAPIDQPSSMLHCAKLTDSEARRHIIADQLSFLYWIPCCNAIR